MNRSHAPWDFRGRLAESPSAGPDADLPVIATSAINEHTPMMPSAVFSGVDSRPWWPVEAVVRGLLLLVLVVTGNVAAEPGIGQPLVLSRGKVDRVRTVDELKNALETANRAGIAHTLLLEDGTYVLDVPMLEIQCPGLVIRSASGQRENVILRGPDEGTKAAVANVFLISANDVVIADMTLGHCRYHGIQVRGEPPFHVSGLRVHNCRIVNCNQQFIKGSSSENDPLGATDSVIEQCLFEFTSGWAYQYYTGGIDIHKGVNWIVRDNLFRNLRVPAGQPGMAEHAIHFWKRCATRPQNVVVERNWVVNCDRGIGFGLGSVEGGFQGGASVIRNNVVFNDGTGPRTDVGIGLEHASGVLVESNTVVVQNYWAPMEYRFAGSSKVVFRNNLVNRPIQRRDDAPPALQENNLERVESSWFQDMGAGDLRLTDSARATLGVGAVLEAPLNTPNAVPRPREAARDVGAIEVSSAASEPKPSLPYPRSEIIGGMTWHWETLVASAPGSDLWPVTWGADDHLYAAWGDGGGFGGSDSDGRVALGFARLEGLPERWQGFNVNGGRNAEHPASFPQKGKTAGLAMVDGVLYATVNLEDGTWPDVNHVLVWSVDQGATWAKAGWVFPKGTGRFQPATFVAFGRDYAGVPDSLAGYVYLCGPRQSAGRGSGNRLYLARAPRSRLQDLAAYEFFERLDEQGNPRWVAREAEAQPVFLDDRGVTPGSMVYDPALRRFLLTSFHVGPGQLGVFEAPNPWGPWHTIAYHEDWGQMSAEGEGLLCSFPPKWMSANGLTLWCVFSVYGAGAKQGIHGHDRFNLVKATLQPAAPTSREHR